tara:strand:- start:315 stop:1310 length:996 start_codon:yes stop_codon:yes gene_type:complete
MKTLYCDGVFDLFHKGHLEHLKKVKNYFKNEETKLVVGIIDDKTCFEYKRKPIFDQDKRKAILDSCKYVDETIITDMLIMTTDFISENRITHVFHAFGDSKDEEKQDLFFKIPKDMGIFIPIEYNKGISTTEIIESNDWANIWEKKGAINTQDAYLLNGWEETEFKPEILIKNIEKNMNMNENDRLLEMGCGAGLLSTFFKKYRYFGVDKSCSLVNKHINMFNNIVLNFSSVDVIFKNNYFDYAIVNSMFEYLKDYEEVKKTIDELERVSKKGVFIANIREFTHNKKLDKHKFDGVFTHLTLERSFFIEKGYTITDCYHNDKQRYNAYKLF